ANMRIYLDGVQVASQALSGSITYNGNGDDLIGKAYDGRLSQAAIDEVGLYSRALSAPEIQNISHLGGAGKGGATIQGNYIGTNAAGTVALANGGNGINVNSGASNNTIG